MKAYDAIIIGLGGIGSAALDQLTGRGLRVLGLEQFEIGHDQGSSHGATRLIRKSYFEHPNYVPLLDDAYRMWSELEADVNQTLFHRTGLLLAGPADGPIISGVKRAAAAHEFELDMITVAQAMQRFPGLQPDAEMEVLFEPDAGVLEVENCVRAQVRRAQLHGAEIRTNCVVRSWTIDGSGVVVTTDGEKFRAQKMILCAGAWTGQLLNNLYLSLEVRRKLVFWFSVSDNTYAMGSGRPESNRSRVARGRRYAYPRVQVLDTVRRLERSAQLLKQTQAVKGERFLEAFVQTVMHPTDTDEAGLVDEVSII